MNDDYGYITVRGEKLPLTERGYIAYLILGGAIIVSVVWFILTVTIFALSPLYA